MFVTVDERDARPLYQQLVDEIKTLIVEDKWQATLSAQVQAEVERIIQQLANRVKELEERYAEPLSVITQSVATLSEKVADHLKAMGLEV